MLPDYDDEDEKAYARKSRRVSKTDQRFLIIKNIDIMSQSVQSGIQYYYKIPLYISLCFLLQKL